jgi:hypothetical protein
MWTCFRAGSEAPINDKTELEKIVKGLANSEGGADIVRYINTRGGAEKMAVILRALVVLQEKEKCTKQGVQMDQDHCEKLNDDTLSMLASFGVVSALILTVLYPLVLSPFSPSEASASYFNETTIQAFQYTYFSLLFLSLTLAAIVVVLSARMYAEFGFWLFRPDARLHYLRSGRLGFLAMVNVYCLFAFLLGLPFGVAVNVTPVAGLIATVFTILSVACLAIYVCHHGVLVLQGMQAKEVMNMSAASDAREELLAENGASTVPRSKRTSRTAARRALRLKRRDTAMASQVPAFSASSAASSLSSPPSSTGTTHKGEDGKSQPSEFAVG